MAGSNVKTINWLEILAPANAEFPTNLDRVLGTSDLTGIETLCLVLGEIGPPDAMADSLSSLIGHLPLLQTVNVRAFETTAPSWTASMLALCERTLSLGLEFQADFTIGDDADACAAFDSQESPLALLLGVCRALQKTGAEVRWLIPSRPALSFRMEALFSLAQDEAIDAILIPAGSFPLAINLANTQFTADERLFLWDFVTYRLLDEDRSLFPSSRIALYETLRDALREEGALTLADDQRIKVRVARAASDNKWDLSTEDRLNLAAIRRPGAGTSSGAADIAASRTALALEAVRLLFDGTRALGHWAGALIANALRSNADAAHEKCLPCVLIIGAYGGEHIGDAAILGGVLFRIHRRYGTTRAIVMSQRPNHTRHLLPMLDTPVDVSVEISEQSKARDLVTQVDAVIYAGGPLMDLPKQLVRHLYTVSYAKRAGKPFIAEGIGVGPFVLWPSKWTARRIARMAARISVRTSDDAKVSVVSDLSPEIGRDPAFDYLKTRGNPLTRLADTDRQWIDQLFEQIEGRLAIGINLRPTRPFFTVGVPPSQRAQRTRLTETRMEQQLADAMRRFSEQAAKPPCFVFYPMNPMQFGHSDLRSAYRLKRLLGTSVDFRVWQADPSIDGVIALLRRLDAVISMRFHATIFALSQGCPAIGIDYVIGKRDKVAALLADFGQSQNCGRIDQVTSTWLYDRLSSLATEDARRCSNQEQR